MQLSNIILKNNQIVFAVFPDRRKVNGKNNDVKEKEIIIILSTTRPDHPQAWKRLLIEISRKYLEKKLNDLPIRISTIFFAYSMNTVHIAELKRDIEAFAILFNYIDEV